MGQYQLVAAAADVPATKLLGTSPKGFNATGEYEESSYHETLESMQEAHGTPFLEKHLLLAARSLGIRTDDLVLTVAWKPVDSPTGREYADIRKALIEHDVAAVEAGVLTPEQVLQRLYADETSGFTKPEDGAAGAGLEEMFQELERQAAALSAPVEGTAAAPVQAAPHEDDIQGLFDELARMAGTADAGPEKWITVKGTPVPLDEEGEPAGKVGEKIGAESSQAAQRDIPKTLAEVKTVKQNSKTFPLTAGTVIEKKATFAGRGSRKPLREEGRLIHDFGGKRGQWSHEAGIGYIDFKGQSMKAEIHWFHEPSVGIVGAKKSKWLKQ